MQHAEEAALSWLRRDRALKEPHYLLRDLRQLDDQLDAHLDGLRIAAEAGWAICAEGLRWEEPGEVFAAAVLSLESGAEERIRAVLESATRSAELSRPFVSALAWLEGAAAAPLIGRLLAAESPALRRMGLAASAAHRQDPGQALVDALGDNDDLLRARALRVAGELARGDLLPNLREHLAEAQPSCRCAAAWSVAILGADRAALELLCAAVESGDGDPGKALQLALRRMPIDEAQKWIRRLALMPALARPAVIGIGVLGVPESVPWLLEWMAVPGLARVAGEAFSMTTGAHLGYDRLEGEWPDGFVAGPNEDPRDENVEMDPDENLPWPDREKIAQWWHKHRYRFEPGTRCLVGRPLSDEWLEHVLRHGYQRQRAAAALELAIRRPGQPLFEVRAPALRQLQLLGLKSPGRRAGSGE